MDLEIRPPGPVGVVADNGTGRAGAAHLTGRSDELVRRIACHEASHCVVARALGSIVERVTIKPEGGFEGQCLRRGPETAASLQLRASSSEVLSIMDVAARLSPPEIGEARVAISEGVVRAETLVIELLAGTVGETVALPDVEPLSAEHDLIEARALASVVSFAVEPLLEFCKAEAKAILSANRDVLLSLADALVEHGSLDGEMVDAVISSAIARRQLADEHRRRADWKRRIEGAAWFTTMVGGNDGDTNGRA
jgi:hypothetical protein